MLYYYILNEHRDVADLRSQGGTCKANVLQLPLQRSVKIDVYKRQSHAIVHDEYLYQQRRPSYDVNVDIGNEFERLKRCV